MRIALHAIGAAVLLMAAACNPVANLSQGESQIAQFHDRYARGEYQAIYNATGRQFREVTRADQFTDLMRVINERLGALRSTERSGFNVNSTPGGTTTTVVMDSIYEQGAAREIFTFHGNGEDMELVGWNIQSDRLVYQLEVLAPPVEVQTPEQ